MKFLEAACPQAVFRLRCRDDGVRQTVSTTRGRRGFSEC